MHFPFEILKKSILLSSRYGKYTKEWQDGRSEVTFGAWKADRLHGYAEERLTQCGRECAGEHIELMRFEGYFSYDKRHGLGRLEELVDRSKTIYLGNWNNGKRQGYGIHVNDKRAFFGEFKDNKETELGFTIDYHTGDIISVS